MKGKETCKILKQIRREIARANDIDLVIAECRHQGDCAGTCPRCESEVALLERGLAERRRRGLRVTLAGLSAGLVAVGTSSCDFDSPFATQGDMTVDTEYAELVGETTALGGKADEYVLEGDIIVTEELQGDVPMPEITDEGLLAGVMPAPEDAK